MFTLPPGECFCVTAVSRAPLQQVRLSVLLALLRRRLRHSWYCASCFSIRYDQSRRGRGHSYKLYLPPCSSSARFNFFTYRVINAWNNLPPETDFGSLYTFKRGLNSKILSHFCKVFFITVLTVFINNVEFGLMLLHLQLLYCDIVGGRCRPFCH